MFSGCEEKPDVKDENSILYGKWELAKIKSFSIEEGDLEFDYLQNNIIYEFKTNGVLVVTGDVESVDYKGIEKGDHSYAVTLSQTNEKSPHSLKIDAVSYTFSFGYMFGGSGMELVCGDECNLSYCFVKK